MKPQASKAAYQQLGEHSIVYDTALMTQPDVEWFMPAFWRARQQLIPAGEGRGGTYFLRLENDPQWVLRHYRRGGLVARLDRDRYLWTGLVRTRAWREWHLLYELYRQGLPVPRPVTAHVHRQGRFYRADLITERLPGQSLMERLLQAPLPGAQWRAIGACLREFHAHGVYHADLNAANLMIADDGQVALIDFDRGRLRIPHIFWQRRNLARLQRSLEKLKRQRPDVRFDIQEWQLLLGGYRAAAAQGA